MIDVCILAGGLGTRSSNPHIPKSLQSVRGTPVLYNQLYEINKLFVNQKISVRIIGGFGFDEITEYVLMVKAEFLNLEIEFLEDKNLTGTLAPVIENASRSCSDYSVIILGDLYIKFDSKTFLNNLYKSLVLSPDLVIYAHPNDHPEDSDLVDINPLNGVVSRIFLKNDEINETKGNMAMAGIFVVKNEPLQYLKPKSGDFVKEYCNYLKDFNKKIYGIVTTDLIMDMGTKQRIDKIESAVVDRRICLLSNPSKSAVFFDLDGTLIQNVESKKYFLPDLLNSKALEIVKFCNVHGIPVLIITNQPGIAKGFFTISNFQEFMRGMQSTLAKLGAHLDDIFICPHHPEKGWEGEILDLKINCDCRKPGVKLFTQACDRHNIDLSKSIFLGDSYTDYKAAKAAQVEYVDLTSLDFNEIIFKLNSITNFSNMLERY